VAWSAIAGLTVLTQVVLRRELAPGEFGTMNALFGVALVAVAPLAGLSVALRRELAGAELASLHVPLLNRAAAGWAIACVMVLLATLPALNLPRSSLHFFTILMVVSAVFAVCGRPATPARWCAFVGVSAAVVRLLAGAWAGKDWPTAESGLGGLVLAALLAGLPALRDQPETAPLAEAWKILRPALVPGLATISLALALALLGNADRIAAQGCFTSAQTSNEGFVDYGRFDEYQSSGLLARAVLWGAFPLLLPFYMHRHAQTRTTYASLRWFWIYLAVVFVASIVLAFTGRLEHLLFGGEPDLFLPGFSGAVFLIGLLQGIALFALASRRHVECFTLAACSLGYTVVLFFANSPLLLPSLMAGGALVSLAIVLLVGVVRYARSHP
jgi:hypothetical protein